jgi:hypothetical protein
LRNADVGRRIRLSVRATNAVGTASATSTPTAVVRTVPVSIKGRPYYNGRVRQAGATVVGTATHGADVWTTTATGLVTGRRYGPHGGTLVGIPLNKPIIGMVVTPSGKGYWLFASDGGVFAFGDAKFYGSTGGKRLFAPIVSMTATPDGKGYWLFAQDGGVFTFGSARFYGSTGGRTFAHPVIAMLATTTGRGYWLVTTDGRALDFGDAKRIGGVSSLGRTDIVGLVSTGAGHRFVTRSLQLLAPR